MEQLPQYYDGEVPAFPLDNETADESALWVKAWTWPQANAWAMPGNEYMVHTVAMWVRVSVRAQKSDAPVALWAQIHRFADQVGLTTAGLSEMGWAVAKDELAEKRAGKVPVADEGPREAPVRRMRG